MSGWLAGVRATVPEHVCDNAPVAGGADLGADRKLKPRVDESQHSPKRKVVPIDGAYMSGFPWRTEPCARIRRFRLTAARSLRRVRRLDTRETPTVKVPPYPTARPRVHEAPASSGVQVPGTSGSFGPLPNSSSTSVVRPAAAPASLTIVPAKPKCPAP